MSDAKVEFSDGRVTWSPGHCECGSSAGWAIDHGRDAQEVMAATCACGERRSLRISGLAAYGGMPNMLVGYGIGGSYDGPPGAVLVTSDRGIIAGYGDVAKLAPPKTAAERCCYCDGEIKPDDYSYNAPDGGGVYCSGACAVEAGWPPPGPFAGYPAAMGRACREQIEEAIEEAFKASADASASYTVQARIAARKLPVVTQQDWAPMEPTDFKPAEWCKQVQATAKALDKLDNPLSNVSRAFCRLAEVWGKTMGPAGQSPPVVKVRECATCGAVLEAFSVVDCHGIEHCSMKCEAIADERETREHVAKLSDAEVLDWAERATERYDHGPGEPDLPGRAAARAEMLARWSARAALPAMRDDFDNLPDAEPEGIVPRGAR